MQHGRCDGDGAHVAGEERGGQPHAGAAGYDYVLEKKELPFPEQQGRRKYTQEEIAQAIAWVDSIPRKDRFSNMSDHEIRQERLIARGLATRGDFS